MMPQQPQLPRGPCVWLCHRPQRQVLTPTREPSMGQVARCSRRGLGLPEGPALPRPLPAAGTQVPFLPLPPRTRPPVPPGRAG